eukprot:GILK01003609.1.p1 GENE.GILK01003609.1~~GILK01003609.1.p1  ORF type:complete len:684 (+),score=128.00 GILK01003609.1:98-2149(+)
MAASSTYRYRNIFLREGVTLQDHLTYCTEDASSYQQELLELIDRNIPLSSAVRGRIFATCWLKRSREFDLLTRLQEVPSFFTVVEILKALKLLDSSRQIRQLTKKIERFEAQKVKASKLLVLKNQLHNLQGETYEGKGASGSLSRRIKKWVSKIPAERLEFFLLQYPKEPWQQLADLCHLNPSDFSLSWFLPAVFNQPVEGSALLEAMQNLSSDNLCDLLKTVPKLSEYYSTIRMKVPPKDFTVEAKLELARRITLQEALWWYEEIDDETVNQGHADIIQAMGFTYQQAAKALNHNQQKLDEACEWLAENIETIDSFPLRPAANRSDRSADGIDAHSNKESVQNIIKKRLEDGETLRANTSGSTTRASYAKLMERLLYFRRRNLCFCDALLPIVRSKLEDITAPPTSMKSVVMGDASGSMQMAINVATIIGSLLSVYLQADLVFFNTELIRPAVIPRDAESVVQVCESIKANGGTAPAAALYEFYSGKKAIDMFVVVTDEEEMDTYKDFRFAPLFKKYLTEVNKAAKIMLISFIPNNAIGRMRQELEAEGVTPLTFTLDVQRPDLTKFESLIGIVANEVAHFDDTMHTPDESVQELTQEMSTKAAITSGDSSDEEAVLVDFSDAVSVASSFVMVKCLKCQQKEKDAILLDCKHQCVCFECASELPECLVCKEPIRSVLKINLT